MHGMCHAPGRTVGRHRDTSLVAPAPPPADQRLTDADRAEVTAVVRRAFGDGILRIDEVDERLSRVYAAETFGDAEAALRGLPQEWVAALQAEEERRQRADRHARRWRGELRGYLRMMALLVGIWGAIFLAGGATYFWPAWPALGWGIPLLLSRPRRPPARTTMRPWDYRSASSRI